MTVNGILQNGALARFRRRVGMIVVLALLTALAGGCDMVPEQERQILVLWHTLTGAEATALEVLTDQFNTENPWRLVLVTEFQDNLLEIWGVRTIV